MWGCGCPTACKKGRTRQGKGQGDVSGGASASEIKSLAGACGYAL